MNKFIIAFGTEGGEFVCNLTELKEEGILEKLMSDDATSPRYDAHKRAVAMFKIRMRANSHRYIETYVLDTEDMTEDIVWDMFEYDADTAIKLIREKGDFIKELSNKAPFEWKVKK